MKIKIKLHNHQLNIPQDFLEKLAINENSEVFLEFDKLTQSLIISTEKNNYDPKNWVISATLNPPTPKIEKSEEDLVEYNYNDL